MYIALAWSANDGDNDEVEAQIDTALAVLDFKNVFKPDTLVGFLYANTPSNSSTRVDDLQTELRKLPISFAISATKHGSLPWRSTDISLATCKRIADFKS